jgi:peptidoglycan hydrolase-like protein with peptidoglycan-binding domain
MMDSAKQTSLQQETSTMTTTTIDPTLQLGAQGEAVKVLQSLINIQVSQRSRIPVDGIFGLKTETAVKLVQYQLLLKRDGIVSSLLWRSLRANMPVDKPILRRGNVGEQVMIVQTVLRDGGYYKGAIDGDFGSKTEAAVKAFQPTEDLVADGVIGNLTWRALSSLAGQLSIV